MPIARLVSRDPQRRPSASRPARGALLGAALSVTGCVQSVRLSVIPTIDTTGVPGVETRVTFAPGFRGPTQLAMTTPVSVGVGVRKPGALQPALGLDTGIEVVQLGTRVGDLGFRAGVTGQSRLYLGLSSSSATSVAAEGALLPTFWTSPPGAPSTPADSLTLGPVLETAWQPAAGGVPSSGRVGLGLSLEWYRITRLIF